MAIKARVLKDRSILESVIPMKLKVENLLLARSIMGHEMHVSQSFNFMSFSFGRILLPTVGSGPVTVEHYQGSGFCPVYSVLVTLDLLIVKHFVHRVSYVATVSIPLWLLGNLVLSVIL